jgi:hypothetical protein
MKRIWLGHPFVWMLAAACAGVPYLACGSPGSVGSPGSGGSPGGGGDTGSGGGGVIFTGVLQGGSPGSGGVVIDGGGSIDGGPPAITCGETIITPEREQVDVFIVLDRSGSMYYSIAEDCYCAPSIGSGTASPLCTNTTNCTNRWDAVSGALSVTMNTMTTINWGLEMYSTPSAATSCTVADAPQVALGTANSAAAVQSAVLHGAPAGNTPTAAAITAAATYLATVTDGLKKAILLATDGYPNCYGGQVNNIDDMDSTLLAIAGAAALDIPVYVVGIGPSVGNLDSMAQAGGTDGYYPATSPKDLGNALDAISKIVATTCTFATPMPPPDESKVWVYVDKTLITEDPSNGWTFGATSSTIVLTGGYCTDFMTGKAMNVQVIFGCQEVDAAPPPYIP